MTLDITYHAVPYHVEVSRFEYTQDMIDFVLYRVERDKRIALDINDVLYWDDDLREQIVNECLKMQME